MPQDKKMPVKIFMEGTRTLARSQFEGELLYRKAVENNVELAPRQLITASFQ